MKNNNPTGKGGARKGEVRNPSGMRAGTKVKANDFKDWAFKVWQTHKDDLEDLIISDQKTAMDFLKICASFVPKEVDLGNKDDKPFRIVIEKG